MARQRRGQKINGIFLLDKPQGLSSQAALTRAKHLLGAQKAGHTGSLDPMATGVLPIMLGTATRLSSMLLDSDKSYRGVVKLGTATDTLDAEGQIVDESVIPVDWQSNLPQVLDDFRGDIMQIPPMVSALKHNGKRLYDIARSGGEVDRPPRPVVIHQLDFRVLDASSFSIEVKCSKGTYIRSLAVDIAGALGASGHLAALQRTAVSNFELHSCIDLLALEALDVTQRMNRVLSPDLALKNYPILEIDAAMAAKVRAVGNPVKIDVKEGWYRMYSDDGQLLALACSDGAGMVIPRKMLIDMPQS